MDPFIGQVVMFGGNFAPRGWALCEGQILPINQNQALFSLLGTTYGGDGRTTFALPDLRGRAAISVGHGAGLSNRAWGQKVGTPTNTITTANMPQHNHVAVMPTSTATPEETSGTIAGGTFYSEDPTAGQNYPNVTCSNTGGGNPINNQQPFLGMNYIILLIPLNILV